MKKIIIAAMIGCCILTCIGCDEQYNDKETKITDDDVKYSGTDTYKKSFSDKFVVDADVKIPENKDYEVVPVQKQKFDSKEVIKILEPKEKLEIVEQDEGIVAYNNDYSKSIGISEGNITLLNKFNTAYSQEIYTFSDKEDWNKENIECMSRKDAIKLALDLCDKLSIDVDKEVCEVCAIDKEGLKKQEKYLIDNSHEFNYYCNQGKIAKKEIDSKSEIYIIKIRTLISGIPIVSKNIPLSDSAGVVFGSSMEFIISSEGVEKFRLGGGIYNPKDVKGENTDIVSLDDALDEVYSIYEAVPLEQCITVKEIALEYSPSIEKLGAESYELIPTWTFKLECKRAEEDKVNSYEEYVYVNAITGKQIR